MTDVLGVCTAWGEGVARVRRTDGSEVEIAIADIIAGKRVPPRPSARDRVSARDAELHGVTMWPDVDAVPLGDWLLRSDPQPVERLFKRANSCLAIGDPGVAFADAEEQVLDFYTARGRDPLVQVERDGSLEADFLATGWEPLGIGDSDFLIGSLAQVSRRLPAPPDARITDDGPRFLVEIDSPALDGRAAAEGRGGVSRPPIASGRAAFHDDWLGVRGLFTDPAFRRRGLARQVMAALVDLGAERGATTVWLHVETDNPPALALYESLGFRTHHSCRYLVSRHVLTDARWRVGTS